MRTSCGEAEQCLGASFKASSALKRDSVTEASVQSCQIGGHLWLAAFFSAWRVNGLPEVDRESESSRGTVFQ
jgi:hypothetical protein